MARRYLLLFTGLSAFALSNACGGSADTNLFSPSGGASFGGGPSAGASSRAGAPSTAGGGTSVAGEASGGAAATAGGSSEGGSHAAGAPSAGSAQGGSSAGAPSAGAGGVGVSGGGNGGNASAGSNTGGGAGSAGAGGSAGTGGAIGDPTCEQLRTLATKQLAAARACVSSMSAPQCAGRVPDLCGCQVAVRFADSAETKAYLQTQKQIEKKSCQLFCVSLVCVPVNGAVCAPSSSVGSDAMCQSGFAAL